MNKFNQEFQLKEIDDTMKKTLMFYKESKAEKKGEEERKKRLKEKDTNLCRGNKTIFC